MSQPRTSVLAAAAVAVAAFAATPALATDTGPVPQSPTAAATSADRLIAKAIARADRHAACKHRSGAWIAEPLGKAPDPVLLAQIAPLRRPAQQGDALPPTVMRGFNLYPGASRRVTAEDGTAGYLTVGRAPLPGPSSACMLRQQMEIARRAPKQRHAVRVLLDRKVRQLRVLAAQKTTDSALLFRADGAFAASLDAVAVRQGPSVAVGLFAEDESRVFGVATDGVAGVRFLDADGGPLTTPVHDNVVSLTAAFSETAYPRFALLDASGAVLRQIG